MNDPITDTERTRNHLVDVLAKNLPGVEFVVPHPEDGGKFVFADAQGYFWLIQIETGRVTPGYQGPG